MTFFSIPNRLEDIINYEVFWGTRSGKERPKACLTC